jgi:putative hydrolase of the HAD superfamily
VTSWDNGAGAVITATLWDFGGVILSSPFDAFARYEREHGLADGFIRTLNATNPDTNAWAALEQGAVSFDQFCVLFEAEARAVGGELVAAEVMSLLSGEIRPQMVEALRRCREAGLRTAMLTNNFVGPDVTDSPFSQGADRMGHVLELFDVVVESSRVGVRKPDPRFYQMACDLLGIAPEQAVFLDDLGINLKPARAMGMTTIKVGDPDVALVELEAVLGVPLRSASRLSG